MLEGALREIQQQEAIEVGGYRSTGLEKPLLERELSEDTEGCSQRGLERGGRRSAGGLGFLEI